MVCGSSVECSTQTLKRRLLAAIDIYNPPKPSFDKEGLFIGSIERYAVRLKEAGYQM